MAKIYAVFSYNLKNRMESDATSETSFFDFTN